MASLSPEVLKAIHDAVAEEQHHVASGDAHHSRSLLHSGRSLLDADDVGTGLDMFFLLMCGYMVRAEARARVGVTCVSYTAWTAVLTTLHSRPVPAGVPHAAWLRDVVR
eukprot:1159707-Pelagomonas_calceolata.AAC.2